MTPKMVTGLNCGDEDGPVETKIIEQEINTTPDGSVIFLDWPSHLGEDLTNQNDTTILIIPETTHGSIDLHVTSFVNECLGIVVFFNATSGNFTEYNADLGFSIIHFIAYLMPSDQAYTFDACYYHRTTDVLVSDATASTPSKPNWHLPKHLYEKVVALRLGRLGAKISKLTKNWSHYLSIPILTSLLAYMYDTDQRGYLLFGKTTSKKLWD
ncbi:hypothetical protein Tco_1169266, partial [Tanacetum coccineum]